MPVERELEALVVDLMASDPIIVTAELPVAKVAEVLTDHDVGGLPVVDATGRLIGVVSQTDLLDLLASSDTPLDSMALSAREVMTQPAVTIRGSASLGEAAQLMRDRHVARLLVVGDDSDLALGVISDSDVIRGLTR
jgi:CBS domain-containing protein